MEQTRAEIVTQRVADFKQSFESGPGMRTLAHLSEFCFEKGMTFVENSDISAFREGKRAVILEIRRWLEFDLTKLRKENDNEQDRIS